MSSITLILHDHLEDIPHIKSCLKPGISVNTYSGFTTKAQVDAFFTKNVKKAGMTIGLMYHNPGDDDIPLFPGVKLYKVEGVMKHFLEKCKAAKVSVIDLITCGIINDVVRVHLHVLSNMYNIDIRYSVDRSSTDNNWVMESHGINIEPIYFTKPLDPKISLGFSIVGFILNSNNKICTKEHYTETTVKGGRIVTTVSTGHLSFSGRGSNTLIVNSDNTLTCWGQSAYGELGPVGATYEPVTRTDYTYLSVSTSITGTSAIVDDGGVRKAIAVGGNYNYENGVGSTNVNLTSWAYCIDNLDNVITDVSQIVRSARNSWILKNDGTVWGAGSGSENQLTGQGTESQNKFVQVNRLVDGFYTPLENVVKIVGEGSIHDGACAVLDDGSVLIWGLHGTGNTQPIESTASECGTRQISITGKTIVDIYPYITTYYHHFAYLKTSDNRYYTVDYTGIPVEDTSIAPDSATIGGTGKYIVKIIRNPQGFISIDNAGDVYYRGRFVYGEVPYSSDYNAGWTKVSYLSNIVDIDTYCGSYAFKSIDSSGVVRIHGNAIVYDFGFDPSYLYELDFFEGKTPIQAVNAGYFAAILDNQNNVHVRMYYTPQGSREAFEEYQLTDSNDVIQLCSSDAGYIGFLKKDGTIWLFGSIFYAGSGFNRYSYELQQWGHSYTSTKFTMLALSYWAVFGLDQDGSVYASGNNISYMFGPSHTGAGSYNETTEIHIYDEYSTLIRRNHGDVISGWDKKIVAIYSPNNVSLHMVFEGGYVAVTGRGNGSGNGDRVGPHYYLVWGQARDQPLENIISVTAYSYYTYGTIYRTSTGLAYYSGHGNGWYGMAGFSGTGYCKVMPDVNGVSFRNSEFISFNNQGKAILFKDALGDVYAVGSELKSVGAGVGGSSVPILYSSIIGDSFTIKDTQNVALITGGSLSASTAYLIENYEGNSLKSKIKEFIFTQARLFSGNVVRVQSSAVSDLFAASFASELSSSPRSILIKVKEQGKYVLSSSDVTNLGNGDVLYIADTGTSSGVPVTLTIGEVDYTYTLYTDKITYNSTDYDIGDTITFGSLNLVVKGFSSSEFIQSGTEGGSVAVPCFDGNTLINTPVGFKKIKDLRDGDMITLHNCVEKVKIIKNVYQKTTKETAPYMIEKDALAENIPFADTIVSPTHAIFFGKNMFSFPIALSECTDKIYQLPAGKKQIYYNLETPNYFNSLMMANGLLAETFVSDQVPKNHKLYYFHKHGPYYTRAVVKKDLIMR